MSTLVAHGLVREDNGQLVLDNRSSFAADVKRFAGKRVTVTVEEEKEAYTDAQRRRFWKMCQLVADIWNAGKDVREWVSKDVAKLALCRAFVGCVATPFGLEPKGITGMSVAELGEVMDKIESHFAAEGTPLPLDGVA